MTALRQFCDTLDEAVERGSAALGSNADLHRVLFVPADTDAAQTMADTDEHTMVIHCRDLIWPNWYMITRDIGLKQQEFNEETMLNAMLEIERQKGYSPS